MFLSCFSLFKNLVYASYCSGHVSLVCPCFFHVSQYLCDWDNCVTVPKVASLFYSSCHENHRCLYPTMLLFFTIIILHIFAKTATVGSLSSVCFITMVLRPINSNIICFNKAFTDIFCLFVFH